MKFRIIAVTVMATAAVAAAGCGGEEKSASGGDGGAESGSTTISLESQEDSGITGDVEFTEEDGKTLVKLTLEGAEDGKAYAAHVHPGTCDELDPTPKYPLEDTKDGSSETTIDATAKELKESEFAVNVHDADDPMKYVACGNIDGSASGGGSDSGGY